MPPVDDALAHLEANGTECFEGNLRGMVALCGDAGVAVYLLTQPYLDLPPPGDDPDAARLEAGYRQGQREHNAVVLAVAATTDAGLVDLNGAMPRDRALFADPIHMTAAGNRVKAGLIADALLDAGAVQPAR
jgi:hypothetical protein